jgi:hypothetical protein
MQRSNAPLLSRSAAESLASVYQPYKCRCMYLRTMSRICVGESNVMVGTTLRRPLVVSAPVSGFRIR